MCPKWKVGIGRDRRPGSDFRHPRRMVGLTACDTKPTSAPLSTHRQRCLLSRAKQTSSRLGCRQRTNAIPQLLNRAELDVCGDRAYPSPQDLIASNAPRARGRRVGAPGIAADIERFANRIKSKVCSRVERMLAVIKRQWGFNRVRCKGLTKSATTGGA